MKVIDLKETCSACPTIFEWKNKKGEDVYFRLRHGCARIVNETKDKVIISDYFEYGDGVCSWEDVVRWAKDNDIKLKQ